MRMSNEKAARMQRAAWSSGVGDGRPYMSGSLQSLTVCSRPVAVRSSKP
jgi:hypothetical protein